MGEDVEVLVTEKSNLCWVKYEDYLIKVVVEEDLAFLIKGLTSFKLRQLKAR